MPSRLIAGIGPEFLVASRFALATIPSMIRDKSGKNSDNPSKGVIACAAELSALARADQALRLAGGRLHEPAVARRAGRGGGGRRGARPKRIPKGSTIPSGSPNQREEYVREILRDIFLRSRGLLLLRRENAIATNILLPRLGALSRAVQALPEMR